MNKTHSEKLRFNPMKAIRHDIQHLNINTKKSSGVETRLCDNMLHMAQDIMERNNPICQ